MYVSTLLEILVKTIAGIGLGYYGLQRLDEFQPFLRFWAAHSTPAPNPQHLVSTLLEILGRKMILRQENCTTKRRFNPS